VPESTVAYVQRSGTPHEAEIYALANVYRFILDCHTKKEAASRQSRPDAGKEINEQSGKTIIPGK
jgi:hypothetical protein